MVGFNGVDIYPASGTKVKVLMPEKSVVRGRGMAMMPEKSALISRLQ